MASKELQDKLLRAARAVQPVFDKTLAEIDDAESKFSDNVDVSFYDGDITVDQVEANDIAEDY